MLSHGLLFYALFCAFIPATLGNEKVKNATAAGGAQFFGTPPFQFPNYPYAVPPTPPFSYYKPGAAPPILPMPMPGLTNPAFPGAPPPSPFGMMPPMPFGPPPMPPMQLPPMPRAPPIPMPRMPMPEPVPAPRPGFPPEMMAPQPFPAVPAGPIPAPFPLQTPFMPFGPMPGPFPGMPLPHPLPPPPPVFPVPPIFPLPPPIFPLPPPIFPLPPPMPLPPIFPPPPPFPLPPVFPLPPPPPMIPIPPPIDFFYCSAHASVALAISFDSPKKIIPPPIALSAPPLVAASRDSSDPEVGIGRPPIMPPHFHHPLVESRQFCRYVAVGSPLSCDNCCRVAAHYSPLIKEQVIGLLLLFDPTKPPVPPVVGISLRRKKRQASIPPVAQTTAVVDGRRYQCVCCAPKHLLTYF